MHDFGLVIYNYPCLHNNNARCDDLFVEPRHKDAVGVHFKTVLFYHFYHQEALKLFFDDSSFVYESFFCDFMLHFY